MRGLFGITLGVVAVAACTLGTDCDGYSERERPSSDAASPEVAQPTSPDGGNAGETGPRIHLLPKAGTFAYAGAGSEVLSFVGADASFDATQGPKMTATISEPDGGCWRFTLSVTPKHTEEVELCAIDGGLEQIRARDVQGNFPIGNSATLDCSNPPNTFVAPGMELGATFKHACIGTNNGIDGGFITAGTVVWRSVEAIVVDGHTERALYLVSSNELRGTQSGTVVDEYWLAERDGMPLKGTRRSSIQSPFLYGPITALMYEEKSAWSLSSRGPIDASIDASND
jgi:hypothetical protein